MLTAVVAALIAIAVAIVVIVVIARIWENHRSDKMRSPRHKVTSIDTVGVASTLDQVTDTPHIASSMSPTAFPADGLQPRFVAMGILATAIFGALAVKTFTMQVLNTDRYQRQANNNRFSTIFSPAPRGCIYDRDGVELVKNKTSLTVLAEADVANDWDVLLRLAAVLGVPAPVLRLRAQNTSAGAQAARVMASGATMRQIAYIAEHSDAFSGVSVETRMVRDYPFGGLAAHLLGYTGTASEDDLSVVSEGREIKMGDDVGKSGIEAQYDNILAGEHGQRRVVTDSQGNVISVESETQAAKGSDIVLTINAQVQYMCDHMLQEMIAPEDNTIGTGKGTAGAMVVMDIRNGDIIAMSSFPTYLPGEFVGGIAENVWNIYNSDEAKNPLLNRAIAGTYPAASTFKAFTGLAGLTYGYIDPKTSKWFCSGSWDGFGSGDWQDCWKHEGHQEIDFRTGIVDSCDIVFYETAKTFFDNRETIGYTALQDEVIKFGFGSRTGVDLSGEEYGRVPTPDWKAEYFKDVPEEASWKGGDLTNMSIGQGYILITPLQLAVGYGGIATGKLVQPHLLKDVLNDRGEAVVSYEPVVVGTPDVEEKNLKVIRDALHGVALEHGTVRNYFVPINLDGACKTGTAEVTGKKDYSLGVVYAPYDNPKYVAASVVEEGGGGAETSIPLCVEAIRAALAMDDGTLEFGVDYVMGSTGKLKETSHASGGRTD